MIILNILYVSVSCFFAKKGAGNAVNDLSDDDLDAVAGGHGAEDCKFTYEDEENCIVADGCDEVLRRYNGYSIKSGTTNPSGKRQRKK